MKTIYFDITSLYHTGSLTGIQRVVRSLVPKFIKADDYKVIIVIYDTVENSFVVLDNHKALKLLTTKRKLKIQSQSKVKISEFESNSIYFDIDSAWNVPHKRSWLYPQLKAEGVQIYTYIYDIVPVLFPKFTHPNTLRNFLIFLSAVYTYSDLIFTDSRSTERDFISLKSRLNIKRHIPTVVTNLGCDFTHKVGRKTFNRSVIRLRKKKYLLFVGTLEPRKNQKLALEAFMELAAKDKKLHLVFVGKAGWLNHKFIEELEKNTYYQRRIHWLIDVDDRSLEKLYKNCFLSIYLSSYEGYGLPIAEALKFGRPVIASNNSSMYEVGKDFADYINYETKTELKETIELYLRSNELYNKKLQLIAEHYIHVSWDAVFRVIDCAIRGTKKQFVIGGQRKLQHVCISVHPENFEKSVIMHDRFASYVKEYIVVTQKQLMQQFRAISSKHKIKVLDEEKVLGTKYKQFTNSGHVKKNWILRTSISKLSQIDEEYIMHDDDNMPLKPIALDYFIKNGRYNAYYYADLLKWKHLQTDYDNAQHDTAEILSRHNLETLSYSVHSPQIINKTIYKQAIDFFKKEPRQVNLDDWSFYFNYACTHYPFLFEKRVFQTLNWPSTPADWETEYVPEKYTYENYYEHIYKSGIYKNINFVDSSQVKVRLKSKQLKPYNLTSILMQEAINLSKKYELVHGVIIFKGSNNDAVFLSGIPYLFAGTPGVTKKIKINFKILNPISTAAYKLVIQNRGGATLSVDLETRTMYTVPGYREGVVEAPIDFAKLGSYDVNFVVKKNNQDLQVISGRYDSILISCKEGESLGEILATLKAAEVIS